MFRILITLTATFLLFACATPMRLGISEAEWNNFSPEEKSKIKKGYYEIQKTRLHSRETVIPDGTKLHVTIYGGVVNVPPFANKVSYSPVEFDIENGTRQIVSIRELNGDNKISMIAAYQNKTLFLDPSRYDPEKKEGSIQLHYSPIWDRGFTYENVSSTGYVYLSKVNVTVKKRVDAQAQD